MAKENTKQAKKQAKTKASRARREAYKSTGDYWKDIMRNPAISDEDKQQRYFDEFIQDGYHPYEEDEDGEPITATREEMELEAIKRLEFLTHVGLLDAVLKHWSYRGNDTYYTDYKLYYSDQQPFIPVLYWVDQEESVINRNEHLRDIVSRFEERFGGLVYHVQVLHTRDFGDLPYLWYVSQYPSEWADDRMLMTEGRAFIGCPLPYDEWDLGTTWYRVYGGGLGYSSQQVIPNPRYPLNHSMEEGPISTWWHVA